MLMIKKTNSNLNETKLSNKGLNYHQWYKSVQHLETYTVRHEWTIHIFINCEIKEKQSKMLIESRYHLTYKSSLILLEIFPILDNIYYSLNHASKAYKKFVESL